MAEKKTDGEKESIDNSSITSKDDFDSLIKQGYAALMPAIRVSNSLPKEQQWDLFCTSPSFKPIMDSLGSKALELMALILHHQGMNRDIRKRDLEEKYELVVEANDKILERVSTHLDELSGIRRNPSQTVSNLAPSPVASASGSWNKDLANSAAWKEVKLTKNIQTPVILRNARITQRPQVKFLDKIDNSSSPFEPRIKEKPNALKPLAILLEALPNEDACYSHPYEFELERFQEKIESLNLEPRKPTEPKPIEETELLMITQENQLQDMLQDLCKQTEIAVDLEHHSYRSFQGFTCLMQISTRERDYIVDTLELRHKLYILNEVFTNPKIVKVFHGADCDVQWLQRDLCLYVVNMFDTYQAALLLSLPRLSLAYLLKTFCNVDANKHFQLYDWRTRPLAAAATKYAREDTHFLLYIYDILRNKLIEKSNGGTQMLQSVIYRSTDTCKRRYWKSMFKENSFENMYHHSKKSFDNRQLYALKELYVWRDKTAREEDESTGYVLPNHMLLLIAEKLPKEMQGILACCNPIPPLVRQNLVLLHHIILKAREQPLVARVIAGLNIDKRVRPTLQTNLNLEGALHCPHDLTHSSDFRDDLPTLLNNNLVDINCNTDILAKQPSLTVFGETDGVDDCNRPKVDLPTQIHFMSPFERYKKMLVYIENEEKKHEEEKERIQQDTQTLLDECMRERLLQAAGSGSSGNSNVSCGLLNVKEENLDLNNSHNKRKRDHSQDSTACDLEDEHLLETTIKSESICEEATPKPSSEQTNKHKKKYIRKLLDLEKNSETEDECTPAKKKKMQTNIPMNVSADKKNVRNKTSESAQNKSLSESFEQYDYSQVDYNQYQSSDLAQAPKRSQNNFKHKGKKKQQNKTFTFVRQYGSRGSKK